MAEEEEEGGEDASPSPRELDMTLLHENVGILLHVDPEVSDRNALIELAPTHPGLSESIVADVLATMRGRGFAALHYFEQMSPAVKEEAYAVVSSWLADELPNMAAVASRGDSPEASGWKQAGINSSLLLGGGLLLGVPVLAVGAAVVGGVIGYRQGAEGKAVFDCLRERGRGILEPLVILLHAAPELRDVAPASWRSTLDQKGTALARQLLDTTYRHQCTAKFAPLAAAAESARRAEAASGGAGGPFVSQDTLRTAYECACALRVAHSGTSAVSVWAEHLSLQLIESEWENVPVSPLRAAPSTAIGRGDARLAEPGSDAAAAPSSPSSPTREPGWRLIRSNPTEAARERGELPLLIVALCGVDVMADLLGDVAPAAVDSLPGLRVHRRMHATAMSTLQRLMPALLQHCGKGMHLRIVGHSTAGGIALLIMLEILLAPPLGLGGHAGSLRDGFESIRAMGFGSPLVIASLPPPALPDAKPTSAHDAKPTLKPSNRSVSNPMSDGNGSRGTDPAQNLRWPPRASDSGSTGLPASMKSTTSRSGGSLLGFDSEFDVDAPEPDFSGLAVGRGRSFSGSFNLGADASIMTDGWRARLIGNSQKDPDAWGSGIARAVASVPPPSSLVRAMTGGGTLGLVGKGSAGPIGSTGESPKLAGDGATGMRAYEARAVPPLPSAVVSAGAHFDMFCHQYDVVPRLFGLGNGDATADALRLFLRGGSVSGSGQTASVLAPDGKNDRIRREITARHMAAYGLLGSAHMLFTLPEEEWHDEWKDSSDDDNDDGQEDHSGPSLPHVLSAAAEQQGASQRCWCVTIPTADEERWLRLPPLPYLQHGAEDHHLSRYVEVLGVACGLKVAPLLAPMAQPGPLPLAPRPKVPATTSLPRTTTNPEVWRACKTHEELEPEPQDIEAGGLVAGMTTFANNLASWAMPVAAQKKDEAHSLPRPHPKPELEPEPKRKPVPVPVPVPVPEPEPEPEPQHEIDASW